MTLQDIIDQYSVEAYKIFKDRDANGKAINQFFIFDSHQDYLDKYLHAYADLDNLTEAIIYAVSGFFKITQNGVSFFIQHGHQHQWTDENGNLRGISKNIIQEVRDKLIMRIDVIQAVQDFSQLIEVVNQSKVRGFGLTSIYDTSLRIGAYLRIDPKEVYLHTGALKGCQALEQKGYLPIGTSQLTSVPMELIPQELRIFKPVYLEHFFCAAKERLIKMAPRLL